MLTQLRIRDFAIVEELELELAAGMTAVTGETGAGKSILWTPSVCCWAIAPTAA
jgi:DNA repair protein RecN (Recombination protein N)